MSPPLSIFSFKDYTKITLIIETNRLNHSDTKKLDHFNHVNHYPLCEEFICQTHLYEIKQKSLALWENSNGDPS